MQGTRDQLAEKLRLQGLGCTALGSPFYGDLLARMSADAEEGGPVWDLLAPHADAEFGEAYPLRLLGAVHRFVLAGEAPDLAAHYPTVGGDGDASATWPGFEATLRARAEEIRSSFVRPPQTNEVGRSVPLLAGLMVITKETSLRIRLLEVGASAGLNLLLDRYWYAQEAFSWGDRSSAVRFNELWREGAPPSAAPTIAARAGCDRDPIDVTDPLARRALVSYVWPGQTRRFELLNAALAIAADDPPPLEQAAITDWLPTQLAEPHPGVVTVVFHSIVWSYLSDAERETVRDAITAAGSRATEDAPVAWLRVEPPPELVPAQLRLQLWPGGEERLLANCDYHLGPIHWRATG